MTTPTTEEKPADFNTALTALAEQIKEFDRKAMICKTQDEFIRFEIPVHRFDPLGWLKQQEGFPKFFWADKDGRQTVAAVGSADTITSTKKINYQYLYKKIAANLSDSHPRLRYYGGCAFNSGDQGEEWKPFGTFTFFVPRFELVGEKDQIILACNIAKREFTQDTISQITQQLSMLQFQSWEPTTAVYSVQTRRDSMDKTKWSTRTAHLLKAIEKKTCQKIVLARKTDLEFKSLIPPLDVIQKLRSLTPDCFHFYLQIAPDQVFMGASPERLFRREEKNLTTEALAGTRPRGATKKDDEAQQKSLLSSKKETLEHKIVTDDIVQVLEEVCSKITVEDNCTSLKTEGGYHLLTKISATLRDNVNDATILFVLHPTPAVAGTPTDYALKTIRKEEPFSRGWYAGPIGYFGVDSTEFAVAIRCGLIDEKKISLYAGAGIVSGSEPEQEWREIENKINVYLRIFNHEIR